jgi:hypothetical protein
MRGLALLIGVVVAGAPVSATAQDEALGERVMARVRSALAGTFVASDDLGSLPADGRATGAWMIRPHQTGDRAIEILANTSAAPRKRWPRSVSRLKRHSAAPSCSTSAPSQKPSGRADRRTSMA